MAATIDMHNSPIEVIRNFYEEDSASASRLFSNLKTIERFMEGNIEEEWICFEIINIEGDAVKANCKEPLCNQPAIMEELYKIEAEGQVPTFVVNVSCPCIA